MIPALRNTEQETVVEPQDWGQEVQDESWLGHKCPIHFSKIQPLHLIFITVKQVLLTLLHKVAEKTVFMKQEILRQKAV